MILNKCISFINQGNTSYLNSTMKVLLHTAIFLKSLIKKLNVFKSLPNSATFYFNNILTYKSNCSINDNRIINILEFIKNI